MKITLSRLYEQRFYEFSYRSFRLDELFTIAKELKFDGIEYMATIPELFSDSQKVLRLSKTYKVPILGVHAPLHLLFYTPEVFFNGLCKMIPSFSDCRVFNFHLSGFINPLHRNDAYFKRFLSLAQKNDVPLTLESNPKEFGLQYYPKTTWNPDFFANYCIKNNLSITFDTSHIAHCNYDIVTFFKKYHKHIKLIHLSDCTGDVQHLPLGEGSLPIRNLLQEIKKRKYNEQITFEINHFPKKVTREEKIEAIRKSLNMVKKYAL